MFVVMDKDEYKSKLDSIMSDTTKFEIVNRDPVKNLKVEVNSIIKSINRECKKRVLDPLIGEFSPGYLYGTVKNHKANNPLRPIISQIPTPTVAKQIKNKIITPYLPTKYMLSSTDDFLAILRDRNPEGLICSLDVESLFTNVPVTDTINIICDYVLLQDTRYQPPPPPPIINEEKLRRLLTLCTKEAPFRHINGTMGDHTIGPIHDWAHTIVPTHDCAQTRLCPVTIVPTHDCAHTLLCPHTIVPTHDCAHTWLCPHTIVPTHDCSHTRLCPHKFVPIQVCTQIVWSQSCLGRNVYVCVQTCYNKITKYSSRNTACDCLKVVK